MYYTYIVRCQDNSLYIGITNNLERRLKEHQTQSKKCAKYTKTHQVIKLETCYLSTTRASAAKLEYYLKKLKRLDKELLLTDQNNVILKKLLQHILDTSIYQKAPLSIIKDCNHLIFHKELDKQNLKH